MGAGIAAVAGLENEASSCCAVIEETQAELRKKLANRNERQRELEFLEKGGDPLDFNLIDSSSTLWSLPQADLFTKKFISSEEKIDNTFASFTKRHNVDFISEDGSELKRDGKFTGKYPPDCNATTSDRTPDNLPTSICATLGYDREKLLDVCKSNKIAVKGQYARRSRQRSNHFGDDCSLLLVSRKSELEGGSSNYSPGARGWIPNDGKFQDSIQEGSTLGPGLGTGDQDYFQPQDSIAIVCLKDVQEKVTVVSGDSPSDSQDAGKLDEKSKDTQHVNKLPSLENTVETVSEVPIEKGSVSSSFPCNKELSDSTLLVCMAPIEDDANVCSELTKEGENNLRTETLEEQNTSVETQTTVCGSNSAEKDVAKGLASSESDLPSHLNFPGTVLASEATCNGSNVTHTDVSLELVSVATFPGLLENKINSERGPERMQKIDRVKIKVEGETSQGIDEPLAARLHYNTLTVTTVSEVNNLHAQCSQVGNLVSENAVTEDLQADRNTSLVEKLPDGKWVPGKMELAGLAGDKIDVKEKHFAAKGGHIEVKGHIVEKAANDKFSLHHNAGLVKQRLIQEPCKKSHWDFVLEEVEWLANDFMQERLWKFAAAAQVATQIWKQRQQLDIERAEIQRSQQKIAQSIAKQVTEFWQFCEGFAKNSVKINNAPVVVLSCEKSLGTVNEAEMGSISVELRVSADRILPVEKYAARFLENSAGQQVIPMAEAPPTPDCISESEVYEVPEEICSEGCLFYAVPNHSMESYCQSVVLQWETEYEQTLQDCECTLMEVEVNANAEEIECISGNHGAAPYAFPIITGKRSSGLLGVNRTHASIIPTKRMRTSAVAARQRAVGVAASLPSGSATPLTRSDISSCETSQQEEMSTMVEGSCGKVADVHSSVAFLRSMVAMDVVDSPLKIKKKKKCKTSNGPYNGSAAFDKEYVKHKGEHVRSRSPGLEGFGALNGFRSTSNTTKLNKHIGNRDRVRKYKAGKASLCQSGFGVPWSRIEDQEILGLVYELGANWELVSDVLSSISQLKGIFRKPKDCKERYTLLMEQVGGDDNDTLDDLCSSSHLPMSLARKGGNRILSQHLEETLKSHIDCILQIHQQTRSKRMQNATQERKQLVPEHESHASEHAGFPAVPLTPLELCDQAVESSSHPYSLQHTDGNGLGTSNTLPSGTGIRLSSSALSTFQAENNLQSSSSMASLAANGFAPCDTKRIGSSLGQFTAEEQRSCNNRLVAGRGVPSQAVSATAMAMSTSPDAGISSGNGASALDKGNFIAKE